jgi:ketosteroid isomerase-like protein
MTSDSVLRLFKAIDDMNADAFVAFLTPEGTFKFGNAPPVRGQSAIHQVVAGFWSSIAGSRHQLVRVWTDGPHVAVQGDVTYTRKDQRQVTIPFVNVFRMEGDKIAEYLIHVDTAPLFAA